MSADQSIDWARLDSVLEQVLALPTVDQQTWIEVELSDEPEMRARLTRLISMEREHQPRFDTLMLARDKVLTEASTNLLEDVEDLRVGARYGKWRIVERIGEGGLSMVYRAERADDRYEQTVALKILRASALRGGAIRHFIRERQILSSLDHPALAHIIDGGETATGTPWLVMDYVEGVPITDYCRNRDLALEDRLGLVADVADATQAAHNRLVVHRDIKPANVLVDQEGRARLLDFGIAQLLDQAEDQDDGPTAMTPAYASPEQVRQTPASTASDVYQLGRLMQDVVDGLPLSARHRAVLEKVLADKAQDRYDTAAGFAADLRRLIAGEAPEARLDTPLEALGRAMWRNKPAALLVALLLLGLAGWGVTTSVYASALRHQKDIALAEADRANRGKNMLLDLFRRTDPMEADGPEASIKPLLSLLEPSLDRIRTQLHDDPELQASLIGRVARARERTGDVQGALELAHEAEQVLLEQGLTDSTAYSLAQTYRGSLQIELGKHDPGFSAIDDTLGSLQAAPDTDYYAMDGLLVAAWAYDGNPIRQKALFEEVLRRAQAQHAIGAQLEARTGEARVLYELGKLDAAETAIRKAIALGEANYGADHPRLAMPVSDLGGILRRKEEFDLALDSHRRALSLSRQIYGAEHPIILSHRNNIALTLASAGRYEEAIEEFGDIVDVKRALFGNDSADVGDTLQNLGAMQLRAGKTEEAVATLRQVREIYAVTLSPDHAKRAFPDISLADALIRLGQYEAAEASAQRALDHLSAHLPEGHFATEVSRCLVGISRLRQGDREGAKDPVSHAANILSDLSYAPEISRKKCLQAASELGVSP